MFDLFRRRIRRLTGVVLPLLLAGLIASAQAGETASALYGPGGQTPPAAEIEANRTEPGLRAGSALSGEWMGEGSASAALLEERLAGELGESFALARNGMFVIATDAPRKDLSGRMLSTLILCREALRNEFFDRSPPRPVVVFAFRDTESYRTHLRDFWNETPISPYGHYNYVRRHIVFNCETGLGTMVHELTHALMDAEMPQAPIWIAEGMASLFEQSRVEGRRIRGVVNWRLPELQRKLETPQFTPLAELFRFDDAAFKKKESLHYAEARFFCQYLQSRGALQTVYRNFRDRFEEDATGRRFVEEALGADLERVERDYKAWVAALRYETPALASADG